MKIRHLLFAFALASAPSVHAQFGSFGDIPIEITADGETRFMGGVAVAENNVVIHYDTISIYADYAQYNPDTRDVLVIGNVRIYRDGKLFVGERALYNLETKLLRTGEFRTASFPHFVSGESLSSLTTAQGSAFQISDASVTTSDSSKPDYQMKAGTVLLYPNSHVVLKNVKLYVGQTPVFWFPFVYQSLRTDEGFRFTPGYDSNWGAYLLTQYGFPVTNDLHGLFHLDLRSKRGVAAGLDLLGHYGEHKESWLHLRTYYANDLSTDTNPTANRQEDVSPDRYRISFQTRTYFADDIYATVDFNKLSDRRFLRDFYPSEYRDNPQPDSVASLTKRSENYALTGIVRGRPNAFFDTTQRLPEVVLDIKRQPLFGSGIFYEGETGIANLRRDFARIDDVADAPWQNYQAVRLDTFHQFLLPKTFGGWLSVVPRMGFRATYYSSGARSEFDDLLDVWEGQGLNLNREAKTLFQRSDGSPIFRPAFNLGVESSFKFSRTWEDAQSRVWGLDGLRHVVQPYTNFSYLYSGKDPDQILQFDRLNPSTQLPPIDFPQFTTVDSLASWTIWRFGLRNRLQTRRDDRTINWLELDSYFDVNIDRPDFPGSNVNSGTLSNFYNRLRWNPLPWLSYNLDSQIPLTSQGFVQFNSSFNFIVNPDLQLTVGHRYLDSNPYFSNSNSLRFGGYYRVNDNWGVSFREQYEFQDNVLEIQEYALHRDLSSWVASLGVQIRDNRNPSTDREALDYSLILTFTLKDLPSINLPVSFDPSAMGAAGEE